MNEVDRPTTARRGSVSPVNVVLGIWLIISPFVLGFAQFRTAEWNDIGSGIAAVIFALAGASVLNLLLGIWVIISPFVLGFAGSPTLLWNNVVVGALILIFAIINLGRLRPPATVTP